MPKIDFLLDRAKCGDILIAKVVRNLAKWTHDLQYHIGLAHNFKGYHQLLLMTRAPDKFMKVDGTPAADPYKGYMEQNYWTTRILKKIFSAIHLHLKTDAGSLVLEMMGTLSQLTYFDLLSSNELDITTDSISLIRKVLMLGNDDIDIKLEAIIFCSKLCIQEEIACRIAKSKIIYDLIYMWETCQSDEEVQLHILNLCGQLLKFEGARSSILMGTGKESK